MFDINGSNKNMTTLANKSLLSIDTDKNNCLPTNILTRPTLLLLYKDYIFNYCHIKKNQNKHYKFVFKLTNEHDRQK